MHDFSGNTEWNIQSAALGGDEDGGGGQCVGGGMGGPLAGEETGVDKDITEEGGEQRGVTIRIDTAVYRTIQDANSDTFWGMKAP